MTAKGCSARTRTGLKRKRSDTVDFENDRRFLIDARKQLRASKKSSRDDVLEMRGYLSHLVPPAQERITTRYRGKADSGIEPVDAYILSCDDARDLLQSTRVFNAPVFVSDSANVTGILDSSSTRRPIEQLLSWLTNHEEDHDAWDDDQVLQSISTRELKEIFLESKRADEGRHPYNFADIPSPFPHSGSPVFVQSQQCNLLRDVMRHLLDIEPRDICHTECSDRRDGRCCDKHFLTTEEFVQVQNDWRQWQGTIMLAEAGALTLPHFDMWAFGTWITCLEGEMGFAWLP